MDIRKNNKQPYFKRSFLAIAITASCAGIFPGAVTTSQAYADGQIEGRLATESRNLALAGAVVRLEELNLETVTQRDGQFFFPPVAAGEYTLTVEYLGTEKMSRRVRVADDQTLREDFTLSAGGDTEHVLVIGQAAGINRALNKQRVADSIKSIVSADAIGQLPDANAAEALRRMPGVSVQLDQGEGRFVSVRGLSPDLNSVMINNVRVPSPGNGDRAVALDVVPSDVLESLEVSKTLTPDMDADAIGGTVNVKSLSAFDHDDFFYKLTAEGSHDSNSGNNSPKLAATGSNVFSVGDGVDNLGVAAALSWYDREFATDNVETGGEWDFSDGAKLKEVEMRDYTISRQRLGAVLNFDYKLNKNNDLYLRTLYSEFTDNEQRQGSKLKFDGLVENEPGGLEVDDGEVVMERELKDREEKQKIMSVVFGGISRMDAWTVDYSGGWSRSEEVTPDKREAKFEAKLAEGDLPATFRFNNSEKPVITGPDQFYDASLYEMDKVELSDSETSDREYNVKIDISRDFDWNDNPAMVKFGGKLSRRDKDSDEEVWEVGGDGTLADYQKGVVDYGLGNFGPAVDEKAIKSFVAGQERERQLKDSVVNDYKISEDINAAYIMGRVDIDQWRVLTGIRYEGTKSKTSGYGFVEKDDVESVVARKTSNDYDHWLPALHLRYRFDDKTQLRAAWTHSAVRPNFEQARPGYEREGDEAEVGNPNLKPMESSNLDLGVEHFMGSAGVMSAFVFTKDIKNFIYNRDISGQPGLGIDGLSKAVGADNGDEARVYGLELAYSKKFSSLPSPWNGLLLGANATFVESEAEIRTADHSVKRDISLPGQSDTTANFMLGYETFDLSLRLSVNHQSSYIDEITDLEDKKKDLYVDDHTQVDMTARYQLTENLQVFFQAQNITDEPFYKYTGNKKYNAQYEEYGPSYKLGLTLSNF